MWMSESERNDVNLRKKYTQRRGELQSDILTSSSRLSGKTRG